MWVYVIGHGLLLAYLSGDWNSTNKESVLNKSVKNELWAQWLSVVQRIQPVSRSPLPSSLVVVRVRKATKGTKMKQARHRDAILRMDPEVLILLSSVVGTRGGRLGVPKWEIMYCRGRWAKHQVCAISADVVVSSRKVSHILHFKGFRSILVGNVC